MKVQATSQDAPTLRLQKSIEQALAKSSRFQMSSGGKPGTIVVSFRKPVEEREHMGRHELLYQVDYRSEKGVFLERATGACWSDEIDKCVFNVMRLANQAALKPVREPAR